MPEKEPSKLSFEEKIRILKKIHARSAPDARRQIERWEEDISHLQFEQDWLQHPNTKKFRDVLAQHLDNISTVLQNEENISEEERKMLFRTKDIIFALMAVLSIDPLNEMKSIEGQVDYELEEIDQ